MRLLCLECSETVEVEGDHALDACPNCGGRGIPADPDATVTVTITIHELRILVMWAEFHAAAHNGDPSTGNMQAVVGGIARRLKAQAPDELPVLTFSDELAEVADAYPGMETNFPIHRDDTDPRDES